MMYVKKLISIILLIIPIYSLEVLANTINSSQKIYPPYPEVWGYDFSDFPAVLEGKAGIRAFPMKDGDIWFLVGYNLRYNDPLKGHLSGYKEPEYRLIKFFKREELIISGNQIDKIYKFIDENSIARLYTENPVTIKFNDESSLTQNHTSIPKLCTMPDLISHYLTKNFPDGRSVKYSILAAYPSIKMYSDEGHCEINSAPFIVQKLHFLGHYIIDLKDDTFLAYSTSANMVIRFNKNFETKFKSQYPTTYFNGNYINRNFFVIEYDLIEKLQHDLLDKPLPLYQAVHDHLLLYFKEKYADKVNE